MIEQAAGQVVPAQEVLEMALNLMLEEMVQDAMAQADQVQEEPLVVQELAAQQEPEDHLVQAGQVDRGLALDDQAQD